MEFVYPIIPNDDLPTSSPHNSMFSFLPFNWIFSEWIPYLDRNINYIKTKFPNGYLPVGTKLYHGSLDLDLDFMNLKKNIITFFGLDVVISIWYILEMTSYNKHLHIGKIYEFNIIKSIPFNLLEELVNHPKENRICKENACIHPQLAYHGTTEADPPYDLSIEVSMNMKYFKTYIQLTETYLVDTNILYHNRYKLFSEFNPVEAIIDKEPNTKKGGKKSSKRK